MTATATLLARINGGSPQSGGITASAADVVQLVAQSYAGWGSPAPRWEILAYPLSWPTPSGWTLESSSGIIYYLGTTPPAFTLPSAGDVTGGMFGVWRFALTVNGGGSADLIDKGKTSIEIVSDNGVRDIAYGENKEFDPKFGYSSKMMGNNRLLDQSVGASLAIVIGTPALVTSGIGSNGVSAGVPRADHSHQLTEGVFRNVAALLAGPLAVNSQRIINVALPVDPADAVPKLHVDTMTYKLFVRGASLGNQSLSGALTEDGITYQTGDLYLAKDQSTGSQNGVYVVSTAGAWTRHTSMSLSAHLTNGALVGVRAGSVNASTGWVLTTAAPITLNTTALVFAKVWQPIGPAATATSFQLASAVGGITRSMPLNWRAYFVSGSESWVPTTTGTTKQNVIDAAAECYIQLDLLHGSHLDNMHFRANGSGVALDPDPATFPIYTIARQHKTTLAQGVVGSGPEQGVADGVLYRETHATTVACSAHVVDRANYRYYIKVSPEYGADSQVGFQLDSVVAEYTLPAGFVIGLS